VEAGDVGAGDERRLRKIAAERASLSYHADTLQAKIPPSAGASARSEDKSPVYHPGFWLPPANAKIRVPYLNRDAQHPAILEFMELVGVYGDWTFSILDGLDESTSAIMRRSALYPQLTAYDPC
jgi:hypothetical protein